MLKRIHKSHLGMVTSKQRAKYKRKPKKTCLLIVWNPHWVQQTLQFTLLVLELFVIQSHLLWGEFSICALCCSYSQSLQFSFLVPPGTHHCWVDRGGVIWEACPTPLHMTGHVLPLCENCGQTTSPCLQYPTSSVVYAMSTKVAPHEMPFSQLRGTERWALAWQPSSLTTGPQPPQNTSYIGKGWMAKLKTWSEDARFA